MPIQDNPLAVDPLTLTLRDSDRQWLASRRALFDCTAVRTTVLGWFGLVEES